MPITPDTQFYLCSLSKQFTSMAVAILEDRGQLKFDEPITNILSDLPHFMDPITLDNLLRHTSGIADYLDEPVPPDTNERVLEYAKHSRKLLFPPGTDFRYSNRGYNILATAVAQRSGQPFPVFMNREIFAPLGMTNTLVCTNLELLSANRAVGYQSNKGQYAVSDYALRTFGDGGIFSTLNDMKAWCVAIETHRLLASGKQAQLFKPIKLKDGREMTYGRGWYIQDSPLGKYISHSGGLYGFKSQIAWCPDLKIWVIIFSNRDDYDLGGLALKVMEIQHASTPTELNHSQT